jgi:hypothetical protein
MLLVVFKVCYYLNESDVFRPDEFDNSQQTGTFACSIERPLPFS